VAVTLVPGACHGGGAGAAKKPPTAPPGFSLVGDAAAGFTVAVPLRWKQVPLDDAAFARLELLTRNGSARLATLLQQARPLITKGGKLFAFDPDDDARSSVNLLVEPSQGQGVDDLATGVLRQLEGKLKATKITRSHVTLHGHPAVRARFELPVSTRPGSPPVPETEYFVVQRGNSYILSLLGSSKDLDAIASSFRVT